MSLDFINLFYLFIILLISLIFYIKHKLSFWSRQGVPFELSLIVKQIKSQIWIVDKQCIEKHGKIFG